MAEKHATLAAQITEQAHHLGFDLVGITPAGPSRTAGRYQAWLKKGHHGEMAYLARPDAVARRSDLDRILPGVRSVVTVAANHHTSPLPPELRDDPGRGIFASYAWGDDYHDVLAPRLRQLAAFIEAEAGAPVAHRAYVDTGPILERELAARTGLGFVGKNTNLIQPGLGSWLLLGELLVAAELPPVNSVRQGLLTAAEEGSVRDLAQRHGDLAQSLPVRQGLLTAAEGTCGRCTRCLEACPTDAFVAPYVLDARRCISYLTIELKGPIPRDLRPLLGNRIFGCDVCQEVCPWNRRFARPTAEPAFQPRPDGIAPRLLDLFALDEEGFRERFRGSPVKRARRRGLLRNVAVALGNWGDPAAVPALARALHDAQPLVRGHAAWALGRIASGEARRALEQALNAEADDWVRDELRLALST